MGEVIVLPSRSPHPTMEPNNTAFNTWFELLAFVPPQHRTRLAHDLCHWRLMDDWTAECLLLALDGYEARDGSES